MLSLILTLALMAGGFFLMGAAVAWNLNCVANLHQNSDARIALIGTFLALALFYSNPMATAWVASAHSDGGAWSSEFVLHIPTASDFGTYLAEFFTAWGLVLQPSGWGITLVLTFVALAILNIFIAVSTKGRFDSLGRGKGIKLGLGNVALTFFGMLVATFLFAYFLGTLMWFGDWWWAVLLVLGLGAGGGVTKVYDSSGRRVGTIYHR